MAFFSSSKRDVSSVRRHLETGAQWSKGRTSTVQKVQKGFTEQFQIQVTFK